MWSFMLIFYINSKVAVLIVAQLFSTNALSANAFSLNVLITFTAIYSQSIVNTNNFFTYLNQRKPISGE